jgi:hypothetical protein
VIKAKLSKPFEGECVVMYRGHGYHGGVEMLPDEVSELVEGGATKLRFEDAGPIQQMLVREFRTAARSARK